MELLKDMVISLPVHREVEVNFFNDSVHRKVLLDPSDISLMAGWLRELYDYWRDIIITCLGAFFLVAGFLILYLVFWYVPPALRYLLIVVLPLSFILLAMITWSLLPDSYL